MNNGLVETFVILRLVVCLFVGGILWALFVINKMFILELFQRNLETPVDFVNLGATIDIGLGGTTLPTPRTRVAYILEFCRCLVFGFVLFGFEVVCLF